MRSFKTTEVLPPLDLWYKHHKQLMSQTEREKFDDMYDAVLEVEDDEKVNMEERLEKLKAFVQKLEESFPKEE